MDSLDSLWQSESWDSETIDSPALLALNSTAASGLRTYFVFKEFPKYVEFRAPDLPLLYSGMMVHFDVSIINPRDPSKKRRIFGNHELVQVVFRYGGKYDGLTQYCIWN